ncbi:MAG: 50S ribosomal protein L15 [Candidatus Heimdallarchaeota archaeon]|nr:50S ribosomal protein L15 [Candidatus Heimdallarchaeota archaeon]
MTKRFKKKVRKQRRSKHHGYGVTKGHKKAGSRGGVGKSGGDSHEWSKTVKTRRTYGKHGFTRPPRAVRPKKAMNIGEITEKIDQLLVEGFATKKGKTITVDTIKMGVTKVIGKGRADKMTVIAKDFSSSAKEKLEEAGGKAQIEA